MITMMHSLLFLVILAALAIAVEGSPTTQRRGGFLGSGKVSNITTDFIVDPPFGATTIFPLMEEGRILFMKLITSSRSVNVETPIGKAHCFIAPGKGSLPPCVLVHGICSTAHDYMPLIIRLQRICESVIVIDLPGHGRSGIPEGDPQDIWLVSSLVGVINALVKDKAILFGNSLGGLVSIRAALEIPEKIAALILASPAGGPVSTAELEELKSMFRLSTHQCGVKFVSRVTAYPEKIPKPMMSIMSWACRVRVSSPSIKIIMSTASPEHMLKANELRNLKPPTMLIWGKHERILPSDSLAFYREHMPKHVEFVDDEEFGHVPFLDDVNRLVRIMQKFFVRIGLGDGRARKSTRINLSASLSSSLILPSSPPAA